MTYNIDPSLVFAALADPTRLAIVQRISGAGLPVGQIAEGLPVSRPAVSQHLKVLGDAGLVAVTARGTRRIYRLRPEGIAALRDWCDRLWTDALAAFAEAAEAEAGTAPSSGDRP